MLPDELSFRRWVAAFCAALGLIAMCASFVLAARPAFLEPLFGGLDRMYRVHRWAGMLALVTILIHWAVVPESALSHDIKTTSGFGAEIGEWATIAMLLLAVSVTPGVPYQWWRLSHQTHERLDERINRSLAPL